MRRRFSSSLDMGLLLYSRCIVTFLQTNDINLQIGEFGLFFDVNGLASPLTCCLDHYQRRCSNMRVPTPISSSMYTTIYEMLFLTVLFRVLPPLLQVGPVLPQPQTHSSERCYPVPRKQRFAPIPLNPTTRKEEQGRTGGIRLRVDGISRRSALMVCQACSAKSFELCICGEIASPAKRMKVQGGRSPFSKYCFRADILFRYVLSNRLLLKLVEDPPADMGALFGSTIQQPRAQPLHSTSSISFFGSLPPSGQSKASSLNRFQEVVNKIHSTLVIAPTAPAV